MSVILCAVLLAAAPSAPPPKYELGRKEILRLVEGSPDKYKVAPPPEFTLQWHEQNLMALYDVPGVAVGLIKDGKVIYEENPIAVKTAGQTDLHRLQAAGAVSLGKNLEAGNYVLQVIATDKTNTKKFATQYVEFEIVE